jgi:hypothetical protein
LVIASPLPNGDFDVDEIVRLSTPVSSVWLGPPKLTLSGSQFAKAKPVASQVQMSAGDQPVVVPGGQVQSRTEIAFTEPASRMELRYHLRGTTVRSIPSIAGRALTAISPLVGGVPTNLRVAFMITGSTVHNIQCPVRRRIQDQACSVGQAPRLRVKGNLRWSGAQVLVQFDLPRPQ